MFGTSTISSTDLIAGVGAVSGPAITWLLPVLYVSLGLPVAFIVVRYIISLFKHGIGKTKSN